MTRLQRDLLQFIAAYWVEHLHGPSYEDMMIGAGVAGKSSVHHLLNRLQERGLIERSFNRARGVTVTLRGRQLLAGQPLDEAPSLTPPPFKLADVPTNELLAEINRRWTDDLRAEIKRMNRFAQYEALWSGA